MASTDARPVPRKNVAFRHYFAIRKSDGTLATGWAGADSEVSKDGGAFADCTNEATEIGSSGFGFIDLTSTEMNADAVLYKLTVTTTDALPIALVFFPEEAGDYRIGGDVAITSLSIVNNAGNAVTIQSTGGNGDGLSLEGHGTGHGFHSSGGGTGHGALFSGGATAGDGAQFIGGVGGAGIAAVGDSAPGIFAGAGSGNAAGLELSGNGTGAGLISTGGATGNGLRAIGGATSGDAVVLQGTAGNARGMLIQGQGSNDGLEITAGATGIGLDINGGATSGVGLAIDSVSGDGATITAGGGNGDGLQITGQGNGNGLRVAGGATGDGMTVSTAGTSNIGLAIAGGIAGCVIENGNTGPGLQLVGGAAGAGLEVIANSGNAALFSTSSAGDAIQLLPAGSTNFGIRGTLSAVRQPVKNAAFSNIPVPMVDSTDHVTPKTGLTITVTRSIDGGAYASATGSIAEVANGTYQFDATAADLNGTTIMFKFAASGADDTFISVVTSG